jgi:hypothetical protein
MSYWYQQMPVRCIRLAFPSPSTSQIYSTAAQVTEVTIFIRFYYEWCIPSGLIPRGLIPSGLIQGSNEMSLSYTERSPDHGHSIFGLSK